MYRWRRLQTIISSLFPATLFFLAFATAGSGQEPETPRGPLPLQYLVERSDLIIVATPQSEPNFCLSEGVGPIVPIRSPRFTNCPAATSTSCNSAYITSTNGDPWWGSPFV
jgi:hypothetical protein